MIPPDREIFEVESRIAMRRAQLARHSKQAGTRAMHALASPWALGAAALIGFFVAGGLSRRPKEPPHPERRKEDHLKAAKATGIAGMMMPLAMWLVRMKWGSPVNAAQAVLAQLKNRGQTPSKKNRGQTPSSPRPDIRM
ncbi:MAG: hypothetical protein K0R40_3110 [Burkholderiales bacterium]|jgi:hypothetical protein|nr:hypothetical protein [Burkholderiales bacterium]